MYLRIDDNTGITLLCVHVAMQFAVFAFYLLYLVTFGVVDVDGSA